MFSNLALNFFCVDLILNIIQPRVLMAARALFATRFVWEAARTTRMARAFEEAMLALPAAIASDLESKNCFNT